MVSCLGLGQATINANKWLDLVEAGDWKTLIWWGKQVISGKGGITETAKKASVFNSTK